MTFLPKTVIVLTNACISSTILTFFPNNLLWFYTKNYQKVHFSSYYVYNTGHFIDFSPKKVIFPQNAHAYRALFWLCCLIIHCVFTPKIPKKFIFPQIMPIVQGTLLTFLPKQVVFSSKCACISSTILTFLTNNQLCFYTKNSQIVHFSTNYDTIIQFSKCVCISSMILTIFP